LFFVWFAAVSLPLAKSSRLRRRVKNRDHRADLQLFCRKVPLFHGLDAHDQDFPLPFGLAPSSGVNALGGPPATQSTQVKALTRHFPEITKKTLDI